MCWLSNLLKPKATLERASPKVRIKPEQVQFVVSNLIVNYSDQCYVAAIAPTNSMDPVIDDGMFVVLDRSVKAVDLAAGDIIYFKRPDFEAIHRVMEIGSDGTGWYCRTRGDNNPGLDPGLSRAEHILGVWRATIN